MSAAEALQRAWLTRGPLAIALLPVAAPFGALTALRRLLYQARVLPAHPAGVPVIVVGNLIVGGAGKTPTVMAVVDLLRRHGFHPGVVSRGHGRGGEATDAVIDVQPQTPAARCGDEPLLLRIRLAVPVVVSRDRVAASRALRAAHPDVDVIVTDDGLQHRRLARDVEVIVFDERGAGNGWVLPAGPLREPLTRTAPARSLVVYNAPAATTRWPGHLGRRTLQGPVSLAEWWAGGRAPDAAWQSLAGRPLVAAAGTARPGRFFDMLRARGLHIDPLSLPDHFDFASLPWPDDTADVIVTEKDAVKLAPERMHRTRVWVAPLDFRIEGGFDAALLALLNHPEAPP